MSKQYETNKAVRPAYIRFLFVWPRHIEWPDVPSRCQLVQQRVLAVFPGNCQEESAIQGGFVRVGMIWLRANAQLVRKPCPLHPDTTNQKWSMTVANTWNWMKLNTVLERMVTREVGTIEGWTAETRWNLDTLRSEYVHHSQINTSMGIKISAPGLDDAVAGTELRVSWRQMVVCRSCLQFKDVS